MNRHQRRRAARMARHNQLYETYVRHLPRVPLDAPLERGRVYHMVYFHDEQCAFYSGKSCNCQPTVSRHAEPERS
jgi:hypothetical protein